MAGNAVSWWTTCRAARPRHRRCFSNWIFKSCLFRKTVERTGRYLGRKSTGDIPGAGLHTISPISALPTVTDHQVTIDGTSQPGYVFGGPPLIKLDGSSAGSFVD